jgi:hypothetical protein
MLLLVALLLQPSEDKLEAAAKAFVDSLTDEQRADLVLAYDDKRRDSEVFLPGRRPGLRIGSLDEKPRELLGKATALFLSEFGWKKCQEIAAQGEGGKRSLSDYWVTFFGTPGGGKPYAWRIAEHHLTLLHVTVDPKSPGRFGPILLGSNPGTLFTEQEEAAMAAWKALTDDERKKCRLPGTGTSGQPLKKDTGLLVGDLPEERRRLVQAMLDERLRFFSDPIRENVLKIIRGNGGLERMRLAWFGDPATRAADGGKYDWKLVGDGFLCDFESTNGHVHTTIRGQGQ